MMTKVRNLSEQIMSARRKIDVLIHCRVSTARMTKQVCGECVSALLF